MTKKKTAGSRLKAKDPKQAEPSKPKILIFGKPGVGKTWQALDFPSVYYIDTEGGADLSHYTDKLKASAGAYMGPEDGSLDFQTVIEQFQALASEDHGFKTVVIDSISKLFNTEVANEQARLGEKDQFGASKKGPIRLMRQLVHWVSRIDLNVIFIAHEKAMWGKDNTGQQAQIGTTFDCWDKLEYELHLALEISKVGGSRYALVTKSRLTGFPDREQFDWSYPEFARRYGKDIIEAEAKKIELAGEDSIKEARRLCEALRIEREEIQKWFDKAGCTSWEEMAETDVAKVIKFLKGKL